MDELTRWFEPLDRLLKAPKGQSLIPTSREVKVLLEMGKLAAEGGPQRYFALLTAYVVGRGLGRAEAGGEDVDVEAFLGNTLRWVQETTGLPPAGAEGS